MQLLREFCQPGLDGERAVTTLQDELDSNVPIFEALVCETHSAALLTAAITSAVNAFSSEATEKGRSASGLLRLASRLWRRTCGTG